MRNFRVFFGFILVAALLSCKKQSTVTPQALPEPTQTGTDVIAWTTDGSNYVNRNVYGAVLYDDPTTGKGYLVLQSDIVSNGSYDRALYLTTYSGTPMPMLVGTSYQMSGASNLYEEFDNKGTYEKAQLAGDGSFTITHYDPDKQIISGTFTFSTGYDYIDGVPPRYTTGWFDLNYRLYTTNPDLYVGDVVKNQPVQSPHR